MKGVRGDFVLAVVFDLTIGAFLIWRVTDEPFLIPGVAPYFYLNRLLTLAAGISLTNAAFCLIGARFQARGLKFQRAALLLLLARCLCDWVYFSVFASSAASSLAVSRQILMAFVLLFAFLSHFIIDKVVREARA